MVSRIYIQMHRQQYIEYVPHKYIDAVYTVVVFDGYDSSTNTKGMTLCYHAILQSHDVLFCPEAKKNTKQPRIWNIKAVKQRLGPDICQHILFLHAVLGCDTSRLHGIGKGASLNKYQTRNAFREQAKVLHRHIQLQRTM